MFINLTPHGDAPKLPCVRAKAATAVYRDVGHAIQRLRRGLRPKLSQQALAEAVKISRASITNIERGHHRVQIHVLYEIAAALGVEARDLLPQANRSSLARRLPADVSKKLDPTEQAAVGRLLDPK